MKYFCSIKAFQEEVNVKMNLLESALLIQQKMHGTKELRKLTEKEYQDKELQKLRNVLKNK